MSRREPGFRTGAASLLLIFSVLCLTILAVLSLLLANRSMTLAQKTADSVTAYYAADREAEQIRTAILDAAASGMPMPDSVNGVAVSPDGDTYAYLVPIDGAQSLSVLLSGTGARLRWQAVSTSDWTESDSFAVWDGSTLP